MTLLPRILVVDASDAYRAAVVRYLTSRGHCADGVRDATGALSALRVRPVALVLIEPGAVETPDDAELHRWFRDNRCTTVVLVTASTGARQIPAALHDVASEVMVKTRFSLADLGTLVGRLVDGAGL
jgi:DNA-binding response OmpR family regulator